MSTSTPPLLQSIVGEKVLNHPINPASPQPQQQQQQKQQQKPQDNKNVGDAAKPKRLQNLPVRDLLTGSREDYLNIGVPLYEASIKCDWKAAKAIIDQKKELVRYSITENGETALHVAASAKGPKHVEEFVQNLVDMMTPKDLALENESFNTALYLAAAAGNLATVKIMFKKNRNLVTIPGSNGQSLPLYAAALFGHYDVVKYLFKKSDNLSDEDGWTPQNRGWLVGKCVENDMFDVALQIVEGHPGVGRENVLRVLAGKPGAFPKPKSNIFGRTIKPVLTFITSKVGNREKESNALPLLKAVWNDIVKLPKKEIDRILRGQPDSIKQDKSASGSAVKAIQLQDLISEHLAKMLAISKDTIKGSGNTNPVSGKELDQAQQLQKLISAQLVSTHVDTQNITEGTPDSLVLELGNLIFEHIVKLNEKTQKIMKQVAKENQAKSLQKAIYDHAYTMDKERQKVIKKPTKEVYSSRVLFIAAQTGNTNFLVELIRRYPDLIWKVNDDNQTIFHIAVKHRHEGIYNLLYEIGSMKDLITPLKDPNDNNMLHLVGTSSAKDLDDSSGVALQMQRELLWFQEVKKMIPPSYRERKNKDGLTPHELFTSKHKDLVTESGQWMKDTASQCMVVAALIATIVFAAAFTIPGGYDQNSGLPMFQSKATLIVFVVADAISLFSSSASILIFLAILTSRYAERDFLESLPKKLMFGLVSLFLSITTMTLVFGVSFFILYHKGLLWIPILIGVIAVMPVLLYVKLQYSLFIDVIRSTYGSKYLFKPTKHVLYYENPKV